jgi:hypothetical protein
MKNIFEDIASIFIQKLKYCNATFNENFGVQENYIYIYIILTIIDNYGL